MINISPRSNWIRSTKHHQNPINSPTVTGSRFNDSKNPINHYNRRKFRSQTSDNMDRWKSRGGKSQGEKEQKWEDQRREIERRKKMQVREKVGKSCGSGGSKSRLAKAAGAEPAGRMRDEKLHAAVARSIFPSQNVQKTTCSNHFWKLTCRKNARHCGAKHIWKSKV